MTDAIELAAAKEEDFRNSDGLRIHLRSWHPEGAARAVVVLSHGFNSHSGQYGWVAQRLAGKGLAVYAPDYRGRGLSEGKRFRVEHVGDYVRDLAETVAIAKSREPGLRVFVLGHSAGGVIGASYVLDHQAEIAGFICESFAFQVPAPGFVLAAIKGLIHLAPDLGVLKLNNADFSRDPVAVAALNADPLIADETQPAITVAALARADERLHDEFPTITIPLLILHGTEDHATVCKGSQFFFDTAGSADKTLKLYEGHYHDLLADLGKEAVMADVTNWLEAHL
jgi:alpha-beta hydrolase superfamily lysophospholipase